MIFIDSVVKIIPNIAVTFSRLVGKTCGAVIAVLPQGKTVICTVKSRLFITRLRISIRKDLMSIAMNHRRIRTIQFISNIHKV